MLFRARLAKRLLQPREEPVVAAHALNFHFAKTMYDVTILQDRHGVEHHLGSRAFFALHLDPCTPRAQRGSGNQCFALQMDDERSARETGGMPAGALISISRRARLTEVSTARRLCVFQCDGGSRSRLRAR